MTWVNAVVQGILLGGVYALLATGLSLMFGVMRIINLAHGDLAVLGAYLILVVLDHWNTSPFLALVPVLPVMLVVGYVLQRTVLERSLRSGILVPLLTTFGLSIVIVGALPLFLSRTQMGRQMRATAQDPDAAELVGVDSKAVYARATAIAVAVAAVAGMFLAIRSTFYPFAGPTQLIFAFEAVVIGGLGSLWGTLVGGIVLGVAQTIGAQIDPQYSVLAGHLVFLAVLASPRGGFFRLRGATI